MTVRGARRAPRGRARLGILDRRVDAVAAFELPMGWEMIAGSREEHVERMRSVTEERTVEAC